MSVLRNSQRGATSCQWSSSQRWVQSTTTSRVPERSCEAQQVAKREKALQLKKKNLKRHVAQGDAAAILPLGSRGRRFDVHLATLDRSRCMCGSMVLLRECSPKDALVQAWSCHVEKGVASSWAGTWSLSHNLYHALFGLMWYVGNPRWTCTCASPDKH